MPTSDDIRDKIQYGHYDPVLEYPRRPDKPMLSYKHTAEDAQLYSQNLTRWEHDMELYREKVSEYRTSAHKLEDQFRNDALDYCGLTLHAKAIKAFSMAQDQSRSDGREAVLNTLEEYADLLL
jgi:hypothetical protein